MNQKSALNQRSAAWLGIVSCLAGLSVMLGGGCSREKKPKSLRSAKVPQMVTPDLSGLEPVVREQIESARKVLASDPNNADANGKLAILYDLYHLSDAAEVFYRRATGLDPKAYRWPYALGRLEKGRGKLDDAVTAFRTAVEAKPDFIPALGELGDTLFSKGDAAEARATYEKILKLDPDSPTASYALGKDDLDHGRYEEAAEHLKRVLVGEPRCGPAHRALAEVYEKLDRPDRAAREQLEGCSAVGVPRFPDDEAAVLMAEATGSEYEILRARSLATAGQLQEALQHADKALEFAPKSAAAHVAKAMILYRMGQRDKSLELLQAAAELAPDDAMILCQQAGVFMDRRQWDEADRLLTKALQLDPKNVLARTNLARVSIAQGQPQSALDYVKPAVDANSNAIEARLVYAQTLLLLDKVEEGRAELERLVTDAPAYGAAHMLLGQVDRMRGDTDGAIGQYEAATEAQPDDPEPYVVLSNLYFRIGQYGQADKVLRERAMRYVPRSPNVRNAVAWLAATCPDPMYRNGASALRMAQALCQDTQNRSPYYVDTLAAALAEVGKFEEAVRAQQQAIDMLKAQGQDPLPGMEERLKLYQAGQPYRASPTLAQPTTRSAEAGDRE